MVRMPFPAVAVAALLAAAVAGCAAEPVSPLPVDAAPAPSAPTGAAPTGVAAGPGDPSVAPTRTGRGGNRATPATNQAARPTACLGAVRQDLDTLDELRPGSLCLHVGGVLRVRNAGPGQVHAAPAALVRSQYAAGVTDVRFVGAGTVRVSYPEGNGTDTVTVVVLR